MSDPFVLFQKFLSCVRCTNGKSQISDIMLDAFISIADREKNCIEFCFFYRSSWNIPEFFLVDIYSHPFFLPPDGNMYGIVFIAQYGWVRSTTCIAYGIFSESKPGCCEISACVGIV